MEITENKLYSDISEEYVLREPEVEDGSEIWHLIRDTGVLDLNSSYSYLMMCKFFRDTCVVAESDDGEIVGFVSAFRPPTRPDVIFVWQVAVAESERGKGLGLTLLKDLLSREQLKDVRYLEATVTPSNIPSQSLFRKLAREMDTECKVQECFSEEVFPGDEHEPEMTFRIGPFRKHHLS